MTLTRFSGDQSEFYIATGIRGLPTVYPQRDLVTGWLYVWSRLRFANRVASRVMYGLNNYINSRQQINYNYFYTNSPILYSVFVL